MKKPRSYVVLAVLASAALYFAIRQSSSGRTWIDWIVLGLFSLAVIWNLVQAGRRLYRSGGGKDLWHLQRTLLFWVIGLLNTALIRPEDVGSWKNIVGWAMLVLAVADTVLLSRKEYAVTAPHLAEPAAPTD
jgi:hypothetical protein